MNYNKIEELFVDFILDIIGPNLVRENERNEHLKMLKKIITEIFEKIFRIIQPILWHMVLFQ